MSIVRFNGTFVNKDLSNDTVLCSLDNLCCFISSINSLVFFTMFIDCGKGDNLKRYFAKLYVPRLGLKLLVE